MAQNQERQEQVSVAETPRDTPRWVRVSWGIAIALIVIFLALHLTGNTPMGHGG